MSDKYILDENGKPVPCDDLAVWARWFETTDRCVARDEIGDVRISTVFLGLDHAFGHGLPLLFETMVFGGSHDGFQDRYASREQALAGHEKALKLVTGRVS